jgi:hypothetical protein
MVTNSGYSNDVTPWVYPSHIFWINYWVRNGRKKMEEANCFEEFLEGVSN